MTGTGDGRTTGVSRGARNAALGGFGERLAVRHLQAQGLEVLDTNWRCDIGELDIVARERSTLVFCEVKTRSSSAYGAPVEAVGPRKAARIHGLAGRWMEARGVHAPELRFDVVSVIAARGSRPELTHLRGAF